MKPTKVLVMQNGVFTIFPERYAGADTRVLPAGDGLSQDLLDWFLKDIDVMVSIETFYDGNIEAEARRRGIKTALVTMCEMIPVDRRPTADLLLCPSKLDYDLMMGNKVFIPWPVATDRLKWKERKKAEVFVHSASHGGVVGRKGTQLLIEATRYLKSDAKIVIYSWTGFYAGDRRITLKFQQFKNYWQMWREGDVLVYPQNGNGISLPPVEAMASGLGVITTDIFPFDYFPDRLLVKPTKVEVRPVVPGLLPIPMADIDPKDIAAKIDEIYGQDISEESRYGRDWALENSWEKLGPRYAEALEGLCA
jgi:glycosyltransferase involved in cell wall biosynthesis